MSRRVGKDQCRDKSVWADSKPSRPGPMANVKTSQSGKILGRVGRADVEPSLPGPRSSRVGRPMSKRVSPGGFPVNSAQANVESSRPRPLSSRVGSGWCRAEFFRRMSSPVNPSPCRVESTRTDVETSPSGRILSQVDLSRWSISRLVGLGRFRAESARPMLSLVCSGWCRDKSTRADVETSRHGPMSRRVDPGGCRAELTQADGRCRDEWARWPMSRRVGSMPDAKTSGSETSRFRLMVGVETSLSGHISSRVSRADVEPSWPGSMSRQVGTDRCRAESIRADIESCRLEPMSRRVDTSRSRVELVRSEVELSRLRHMSS